MVETLDEEGFLLDWHVICGCAWDPCQLFMALTDLYFLTR